MKIWKIVLNIILALAVPIILLFGGMMIGGKILDLFLSILNINYDDLSNLEQRTYAMFIPLLIVVLTLLAAFLHHRSLRPLRLPTGFLSKETYKNYGIGIGIVFTFFVVNTILNLLIAGGSITVSAHPDSVKIVLLTIPVVMIQSFYEEILFRGYALGTLLRSTNVYVAILLNPIAFSVLHFNSPDYSEFLVFLIAYFVGVFFSILTLAYNNLWVAAGGHFIWNYTIAIFGDDGEGMLFDTYYSNKDITLWVSVALLIILVILSWIVYKNRIMKINNEIKRKKQFA